MPRIDVEPRAELGEGDQGRGEGQLAVRVRGAADGDDAARRRGAARGTGEEGASTTRRRWNSPTRRTPTNISRASIAQDGRFEDAIHARLAAALLVAGAAVIDACRRIGRCHGRSVAATATRTPRRAWMVAVSTRARGAATRARRDSGRVDASRRHDLEQDAAGRRHRDEGRIRQLRARVRVEDRRGGEQRHLLPRHRGVRPHLLERPRVSAPRQHQAPTTTRRRSRAPAPPTASTRRPTGM